MRKTINLTYILLDGVVEQSHERPPIDEARVATWPGFEMGGIAFHNADIERLNAYISSQPERVVDVYNAFGDPATTRLLSPDRVHAPLDGQIAIARTVVERLVA